MKIRVEKTGGIWHGYVEGHPEIDERGLTAEIAERKAKEAAALLQNGLEPLGRPTARKTHRRF